MGGEEKKKSRRYDHLSSIIMDEDGNYGYHGATYAYSSPDKSRRSFLVKLWTAGIIAACCTVAVGCIPAPGMSNSFYVILPYVGEVAFVGSLIWALVRMTAGGDPMRSYVYEATVEKIPGRAVGAMVFGAIGLLGGLADVFIKGFSGPIWGAIVFFALKLLVVTSAYMIKLNIICANWRKDTNWPEA